MNRCQRVCFLLCYPCCGIKNLFVVSPEGQLEKSRLLVAQHAVDEEKRKYEEEKQREEEKKQREEAERMREIDRKIAVEKKERKRNQRTKVIEEIVNSEKDYLFNLHLCLETFSDRQKPPAGVDLEFLLGNMEEIADVSQKIVISLETSVSEADLEKQCVGQCFINFAEDMKNTYAPYCRNHDEVITAMEKYSDSPEISAYFNSKIEAMKKQTNVFDMASILIRPVQRILKYPLLLNELLKNTEEDHPDREDTKAAIKEMTNVAMAINEYKRRKDLVYKYKNFTDQTFSDKISKLNLHSIMKKSTRMKGRLSANLGIALQMRDEMFEKEETKFRHLERTIRVFLDSIQQYLDQSQETMRSHTVYIDYIKDFYKDKEYAEAIKLYEVTYKQLSLFDNMKATVEHNVVIPLNILSGLFAAPTKIIEKRYDKMLDYNYQLGKEENDKELQAAKNDYEAMNYQLLDELPKFYNLAYKMLRHYISVYTCQARLHGPVTEGKLHFVRASIYGKQNKFNGHI
uniref:Dynamin-binding protein n=1 Tax=Arion vulgaris TaxID=1028688 RepID=A0A0B7BC31_9EUPU